MLAGFGMERTSLHQEPVLEITSDLADLLISSSRKAGHCINPKLSCRIDSAEQALTRRGESSELPSLPGVTHRQDFRPESTVDQGLFPPDQRKLHHIRMFFEGFAHPVDHLARRMAPPRSADRALGYSAHDTRELWVGKQKEAIGPETTQHLR